MLAAQRLTVECTVLFGPNYTELKTSKTHAIYQNSQNANKNHPNSCNLLSRQKNLYINTSMNLISFFKSTRGRDML